MKGAPIILGLIIILVMQTATAQTQNFTMKAEDFGAAILRNMIANLEITQSLLKVLYLANNTPEVQATGNMMQNMWGVIYGSLVLAGWQNQITALAISDLEKNETHRRDIGNAINFLGKNASTVFGDPAGTTGIAKLLNGTVMALSNQSKYYNGTETYLQAYGRAIAAQVNSTVLFLIELAKAIPAAFGT
ncbi:MAG: hypothetical protein QXF37_01635 [Archaeoglobaceae archaeon]